MAGKQTDTASHRAEAGLKTRYVQDYANPQCSKFMEPPEPKIACIDKWVKSKFDNATPPDLCSGPKLAIWNKNQQPGFKKTPMTSQKCEIAILPLFGCRRSLGEKTIASYNDFYSTVYDLYDIYTPPDICLTPLDMIQTPSDTHRHHPDTPQT